MILIFSISILTYCMVFPSLLAYLHYWQSLGKSDGVNELWWSLSDRDLPFRLSLDFAWYCTNWWPWREVLGQTFSTSIAVLFFIVLGFGFFHVLSVEIILDPIVQVNLAKQMLYLWVMPLSFHLSFCLIVGALIIAELSIGDIVRVLPEMCRTSRCWYFC